jgi:hypothetical protein
MGLVIAIILFPIVFMIFGVYVVVKLTVLMLRIVFAPVALVLLLRR